nr:efflux RND transporter periplasmic adaptor subunit [Planctomycetota bacterium]MCH9726289.1 efflux RND transporter periplasmic adaptor subunit [Planctomycetota bacterium]MCH9776677.1 efflux RND transporter periplasmic adaptor subunit [Planctomycetota bacterium]
AGSQTRRSKIRTKSSSESPSHTSDESFHNQRYVFRPAGATFSDRCLQALKEAQQIAKSLPAALSSAKAEVEQSRAAVLEAKQKVEVMRVELEAANVSVAKYEAQYALSQANFDRTTKLFAKSAVTQSQLDTEQRNLDAAKANLDTEKAKREQTQIKYDSRIGGVNTIVIQAQEDLIMAQAKEAKAQFAVESTINGENTAVAQIHQQLNTAKLKLDWTTVRAPADGYVMQLSLREGQRVTALPMRSWMAYVEKERTRVIVGIRQYQLRHIQPGQSAEIAFKLYPGRTISAKVEAVLNMNATGQIQASGVLEDSDATAREQQVTAWFSFWMIHRSMLPSFPAVLLDRRPYTQSIRK